MARTSEEYLLLKSASRIGTTVRFRLPADHKRRSVVGEVIDEVALIRDTHKLVIQQIRYPQHHLWDDDEVAYRLGYFRVVWPYGRKGPKLEWRHHSVLVTTSELTFLLRQAQMKKWALPSIFA